MGRKEMESNRSRVDAVAIEKPMVAFSSVWKFSVFFFVMISFTQKLLILAIHSERAKASSYRRVYSLILEVKNGATHIGYFKFSGLPIN